MAGASMLTLFHLVIFHQSASLPQWVYRVNSCPDPKNISQWIEASKRLNCYHNLISSNPTEQERIYHCLPSSFLNETLEFCSRSVPINSGNCPVYSYEFGTSIEPIFYNCTDFIYGCPTTMFKSKEVYKFPECLKLRPKLRCFEAEKNCTRMSNTTHSNGKFNSGKPVIFLIYICVILPILVVVVIILYKCSNQRCQISQTCHNRIKTLHCQYSNCSKKTEREKDPLLSSNELTTEAKLGDPPLLQPCLYSKRENSKVNSCGGNARDYLEYIDITTSKLVNSDLENDLLLSSNELTTEAKLGDPPLLQPCLYSKRENSKINFCGGNARYNSECIEIMTSNLVKSDLENDPLLSRSELTSEAKLSDPPLLQPCLYSNREYLKINFCGGNTRDYLECIVISSGLKNGPSCHPCLYLCADTLIIGYVYITNTAVTLNKMIKTPLVSCNLSSMRNRFVETEGSMKEDRSESLCTQTSMRLTKHGNFDMILIIEMENNDCKGKKTKHSIKSLFKEPKKNNEMLRSKFEKGFYNKRKVSLHMH